MGHLFVGAALERGFRRIVVADGSTVGEEESGIYGRP